MVVLQNMGIGEDGDSFSGASNQLDQDLYQWYKDMAGQEGVYVIHTDYFDEDLLNVWRGSHTYEQVPQESLWLFTMSPNYLETLGIHADADSLEAAQKGSAAVSFAGYPVSDTAGDHISVADRAGYKKP